MIQTAANTCSTVDELYPRVADAALWPVKRGASPIVGTAIHNVVALGPVWTVLQPSGGQPPEKVEQFGANSAFGRPGHRGDRKVPT